VRHSEGPGTRVNHVVVPRSSPRSFLAAPEEFGTTDSDNVEWKEAHNEREVVEYEAARRQNDLVADLRESMLRVNDDAVDWRWLMQFVTTMDYNALRYVVLGVTPMTVVNECDLARGQRARLAGRTRRGPTPPGSREGPEPYPIRRGRAPRTEGT